MIIQSVKMAWESIIANKMRSFLTMLGIIIGVVALVVLVSLVNGAAGSITSEIETLGTDLLMVSIRDDKGVPMRLEDLRSLLDITSISLVSPSDSMNSTAKYHGEETSISIYGVTPMYEAIQRLEMASGRFVKTADVDNRSYVAVLTHEAARKLFDRQDVVGEKITMGGREFNVIGVLAEDDSMMSLMMGNVNAYVPYTVESRMSGNPYIRSLSIQGNGNMDETEKDTDNWLYERLKQDEDAYNIVNMSSISSAMDTVMGTLSLLLGSIAAISLLVGGIGIMNIMLVSVTERTREIGIRKAIGANHWSIMMQFLIEALLVSLLGCIFGLGLSALILQAATMLADDIVFTMTPDVILVAVGFSSGIGLLFGLYPANKAAKKPPIEALRYEG